jgi:putative phosphoribosyl transferase
VPFLDRSDAGRRLADRLGHHRGEDVVVLGVPRGGIPVAVEVARALAAPLDAVVVRKLSAPFRPELVIGAIGEGGVRRIDQRMVRLARLSGGDVAELERHGRAAFADVDRLYRGERRPRSLAGRTAIVVDDGITTGATARVACDVARARGAAAVVLAVPVAPRDTVVDLAAEADELVCLATPEPFLFIGRWYGDFTRPLDEEALALLRGLHEPQQRPNTDPRPPPRPLGPFGMRRPHTDPDARAHRASLASGRCPSDSRTFNGR